MATTTTSSESINPISDSRFTLLGLATMCANAYGVSAYTNLATTLNAKYKFFADSVPTGAPTMRYFTYGVGGRQNDSGSLGSAARVSGLDMDLFTPMACRAVPIEEDLSLTEMARYGGREIRTVAGQQYAVYHARALDFTASQVQFVRRDPTTGVAQPYTPDPSNLTPVPLTAATDGTVTDIADLVSVVVPATLTIVGSDVIEVVNALFGGDMRYAMISEYGLISASLQSVSALDANNKSFSYDELICAQLASHYTWGGFQFVSEDDNYSRSINLTLANFALKTS